VVVSFKDPQVVRTPRQRTLRVTVSPHVSQESKEALRHIYLGLNPAQLKRDIGRCQDRLIALSKLREATTRKEVRLPHHTPWRHISTLRLEDISREATETPYEDILT
jgi:hypothetical protein